MILYVAAAILIGRAAVEQNLPAFKLDDYVMGAWPMPFQARYLMVPVLRWAAQNREVVRAAAALHESVRGPKELMIQAVDCLCLILLGWLVVQLRARLRPSPFFAWLAPALFLWVVAITFVVRYDQRLFLPYDFPSMLLFTLALVACLDGRLWVLLAIMAVGTYNRETTVFLLPVWLALTWETSRARALIGSGAGLAIWIAVKMHLTRLVGGRTAGWQFNWNWNLAAVAFPHHWAQLLSVGGYLALPMILARSLVVDRRLKLLWLGCAPFFVGTLVFGVWNETRIFGELSALIAVTAACQFEEFEVRRLNSNLAKPEPGPAS